jgi:hypothetical protein
MGVGDFIGMRWVLWDGDPVPPDTIEAMMRFIQYGLSGSVEPAKEARVGEES